MVTLLIENRQQADAIIYLLNQGIEIERLRLEFLELTKSNTLDSYIQIMEGERFLTSLIAAG